MMSPTLLVLAAGMGSRYGGLKQIEPIGPPHDTGSDSGRETIIDYSVYDALRAGFGKVVFVIRKEIEQQFQEFVAARFREHIPVEYVFQETENLPQGFFAPPGRTKPWGTTHAVLMAADAIHEPFAIINADDFYGAQSYRLLANYLKSDAGGYAMVGFVLRNTLSEFGSVARGVCRVTQDGCLEDVTEMTHVEKVGDLVRNTDGKGRVTDLTGNELVSMNMWGFTPSIFAQMRDEFRKFLERHGSDLQSECYLPSTVNALVSVGSASVRVLRTNESWFGVTYREDQARVVESIGRQIQDGYYPKRLWDE